MASYNATLIQDVTEYLAYIEQPLWEILQKFNPREFQSTTAVLKWIISEEIEVLYGLEVIGHRAKLYPYTKIRNKLDRALPLALSTLTMYHIKAPRVYLDNPFVQVDLFHNTDLYIQYYREGMKSALTP
jgi:hypothetical protein